MNILYKRLVNLTPADIQWLVDNRVQEVSSLPAGEHSFPRYSVGSSDTFSELVSAFDNDVANFSGKDHPDQSATFDFGAELNALDQAVAG